MSTNPTRRLDHRLEAVHDALSLAYQFLLALEHHDTENTLDADALSVLTRLVDEARDNARIVGDALPSAIGLVRVADDYEDVTGRGLPLQPVLNEYRQRFGAEKLAVAMDGLAPKAQRTSMPRLQRRDARAVSLRRKGV